MNKLALTLKSLVFSALLLSMIPEQVLAQDPAVVDSSHYTVIFENDQVRVLRINYGSSEKSVMHYHPDGVVIYLSDSTAQFTLPDGTVIDAGGKKGDVIWAPAGNHLPENLSETDEINVIVVELKTHEEENY